MGEETPWSILTFAALIFLFGALFVIGTGVGVKATDDGTSTISITGESKTTADPDEVAIYLNVETLQDTASASQSENAGIFEQVKAQLLLDGVKEEDIKTTYYTVYEYEKSVPCNDSYDDPYYSYYGYGTCYEFAGYKTVHEIEVVSSDVEGSGELLDDVVGAGATVDYLNFQLSDEKEKELENDLISEAVLDAKQKAGIIAGSSGVALGKLQSANYGSLYYSPIYKGYDDYYATAAEGASTSVEPGQIDLSISVSMVFEIK